MSYSSVYIVFISTLLLLLSSSTTHGFGVVPPVASTHQQLADTSLSYRDHPVVDESPTLNIAAEPGFEERTRAAVRSTTPTRTAGKKTTKTTSADRPQSAGNHYEGIQWASNSWKGPIGCGLLSCSLVPSKLYACSSPCFSVSLFHLLFAMHCFLAQILKVTHE